MRRLLSVAANLCIVAGLGGSALLTLRQPDLPVREATPGLPVLAAPDEPAARSGEAAPDRRGGVTDEATADLGGPLSIDASPAPAEREASPVQPRPGPDPAPRLAITRVFIPRIALTAEVVPSRFAASDGRGTWEVPAFRAGHAQYTAGAGEAGNAVLFGHLTSRTAGNVFSELDRVRLGDEVRIFSGAKRFDYRITGVDAVPRTELAVMQPTATASVTLITCAGPWLPLERDYAERLVVRAELQHAPPATADGAASAGDDPVEGSRP